MSTNSFGPSDWINLVNAMCTFAAAAVALGLGVWAMRRESRTRLERAKLFAARITARLTETEQTLGAFVQVLGFLDLTVARDIALVRALGDIRQFLARPLFQPDDETLLALTPLDQRASHRIARAFDLIDRVRAQSDAIPGLIMESTLVAERPLLLSRWAADLTAAHDHLTVAVRACVSAAELAAPLPSGEEKYGKA